MAFWVLRICLTSWDRPACANSLDPDQTSQNADPDQGLHCLLLIQNVLDTSECSKMDLIIISDQYDEELKFSNAVPFI